MSYKAIMKHSPRSFACPGFHAAPLSRRQMLKVGGLGLLGLTLPQLLRAEALKKGPKAKARSVIFLFQWGGPSHLDMFDMKPNAPEQIRGPHKPISSSAQRVCGSFPTSEMRCIGKYERRSAQSVIMMCVRLELRERGRKWG